MDRLMIFAGRRWLILLNNTVFKTLPFYIMVDKQRGKVPIVP